MELEQAKRLEDRGRSDEAIEAYRSLIEQCRAEGRWCVLADSLHHLAGALDWHKSKYSESLEAYKEEISIRKGHNLGGLAPAHLSYAVVSHFLDDDEGAKKNAQIAISLSDDPIGKATAHNLIGDILVRSDHEGAKKHLREAERLLAKQDNPYMLCHVRLSLALLAAYQGDTDGAIARCTRQFELARGLGEPGIIGTAHLRFAEIYHLGRDYDRCKEHAKQAFRIGKKNNWEIMCRQARKILGPSR